LKIDGKVQDSLQQSQTMTFVDPTNVATLKSLARSLHLQGKHKPALKMYEEAIQYAGRDWVRIFDIDRTFLIFTGN
jgi:predicted Zn-dependent protease